MTGGCLNGRLRAIVSVVALYCLLLQGALVGMSRHAATSAAGVAPICAPGHDAPVRDGREVPDHDCCLAACGSAPALPPNPGAHAEAWPARAAVILAVPRFAAAPVTGPPVDATSPRGPPAAA